MYQYKRFFLKHCAALFVDLSKAFDTVDHCLFLQSLHIAYIILDFILRHETSSGTTYQRDNLLNYLGFFKKSVPIVPQGSVLGPVLFTIYINNIVIGKLLYYLSELLCHSDGLYQTHSTDWLLLDAP